MWLLLILSTSSDSSGKTEENDLGVNKAYK